GAGRCRLVASVRLAAPKDTGSLDGLPRPLVGASRYASTPSRTPRRGEAMSPLTKSNNLAARMGRWSASHWKTAVFGWLAFVVLALAIGQVVGTKQIDEQNINVGESHRADQ